MKALLIIFKRHKNIVIGLSLFSFFLLAAIFAPLICSHSPNEIYATSLNLPPFWKENGLPTFLLGTDDLGRDLFSRLIFGARISLTVGISVSLFSCFFGTILGVVSGYFGSTLDKLIMATTDLLMAFPSILLAIIVVSILGPGLFNAIISVSIVSIPNFTRIVRACVMSEKEKDYVSAAVAFGAKDFHIIKNEIMPNISGPIIIQATLTFSDGILNIAALGFLGLGAQPPIPEWGTMLSDARSFIESYPWLVTLPGLCILFCVLGLNILGDGLRDFSDPKLKN